VRNHAGMPKVAVAAVVAALALGLVAQAGAHYYIDRSSAISHAREHFRLLGYRHVSAACHPEYLTQPAPGTTAMFHRWGCNFEAGDGLAPSCTGVISISGSATPGNWWFRVVQHRGPCPRGTER